MIMSDGQPTEPDYVVYDAAQKCTDAVNLGDYIVLEENV